MNIWVKHIANLFLRQHVHNETYKTQQETFLMEGLRRYVCYNIKIQQAFLNRRAFYLSDGLRLTSKKSITKIKTK